jgi:hypothetical protein
MTAPVSWARIEAETERLYALLPSHIRTSDAANGWALKALMELFASGAVEIDTEIDTLYDAMFAETAPEEALRDLSALVAAETLRPLPEGARHSARAFITNTIRYRRGKGTARVLEALAADVGGFGGVAVEYFMRLSRLQNLIDVREERPATAYLVPGTTAANAATAFDILPRLVDFRSIARSNGRHHVPNTGVHIIRPVAPVFPAPPDVGAIPAHLLAGVPLARPWAVGGTEHDGYFQIAAQPGRTLRLFNPDRRAQDNTGRVVESDLGDRLKRLPLHLETEELRHAKLEGRAAQLNESPWFNEKGQPFTIFLGRSVTGKMQFDRVAPEEVRIANLDAAPASAGNRPDAQRAHNWFTGGLPSAVAQTGNSPIKCGFDPATGRLIVAKTGSDPEVEQVRIAYAYGLGAAIGAGPQDRNTNDLPFEVRDNDSVKSLVWVVDASGDNTGGPIPGVSPVATLDEALTQWASQGAGKRGFIILASCDREGLTGTQTEISVTVHPASELHIVSARWVPRKLVPGLPVDPDRKGYVVRKERRFTIDAPLRLLGAASGSKGGRLVLDGLELTQGLGINVRATSALLVRHCTVRAPGQRAIVSTAPLEGMDIAIEHSLVGCIRLDFGSSGAIGKLRVSNSILSRDEAAFETVTARDIDAELTNVTIFGTSSFKSIEATNVIFFGAATAVRTQSGCVRYSSIAQGSTMPRRFRCQPDIALSVAASVKGSALTPDEKLSATLGVQPIFLDESLDEPTVAMLHPLCAEGIWKGGEGETEMGVFSNAAAALRMGNVQSLFDDYVPFGQAAGLIDDTRSTKVAERRNRP